MKTPWILMIDDDRNLCRNVGQILVANGMRASFLDDGSHALSQFRRGAERPDVLVVDVHLPVVTGLDLLRALRAEGISIPTLLISGLRLAISPEQMDVIGCDAFLEKPFGAEQLLRRIREIVPWRATSPELAGSM